MKNTMKRGLIALAASGLLASGVAAAQGYTVRVDRHDGRSFVAIQDSGNDFRRWHDEGRRLDVDERQARISARIDQGLHDGSLTRREARQLERALARTEQKEAAFQADGRLNNRERAELNRDLDTVSQRLRFERRDADRRY